MPSTKKSSTPWLASINALSYPLSQTSCRYAKSIMTSPLNGQTARLSTHLEAHIKSLMGRKDMGQGNNMYIFPGIGLGTILSKARHVTDEMVEAASIALSESLTGHEGAAELVYPCRLERIQENSGKISLAVIRRAQGQVCSLPFVG